MELTPSKSQRETTTTTSKAAHKSTANKGVSEFALPRLNNGELGQIQDLLFGNQLLIINSHLHELRDYIDRQLELVRKDYTEQLTTLGKRIDVEISEVVQKQKNSESEASVKISKNEKMLEKIHVQLSSKISDVGTRLTMELSSKNEAMQQRIDDAIQQLSVQNVDRTALSSLLSDVADQLANGSDSPITVITEKSGQRNKEVMMKKNHY